MCEPAPDTGPPPDLGVDAPVDAPEQDAGGGEADAEAGAEAEPEVDGQADGGQKIESDEGCACALGRAGGRPALVLLAVGLLVARRRGRR
jgi:MYXO-CTERM domain-containing protein